ncbi:UDP-2,4-diacetamido-2,4,6-trideoxy-beta-L-altropyranose hydrolase [Acetivibrio thermocellus AD2]|jgi:UDP-2,4-diacetamido-2,4,6-trideoxy-beta-L-altropyranose hydrolase|uniref:UDP-2,4-diacetamido-2,4, 6-trideoxy-beta-L-altropyranose hydrolase n=1 Tax=Acetivibrio thermocellus AD2 TaxID=1138384 RepID=A0AB36TK36_ACETH|nr:UDP-2,4-diacetamido-2,4,6-trideoxy-beta-L-altropyranose hydrolase [Acetivibrio thermocellus]CDG36736.1 Glycosyltransferase 28 domain protein [Acetivibrio thermocellus BC1]ADU75875.1 pseudaminic acid biosynthesis-associated protein PseG [Acetivibrio thermocellus DSM 1313]ALX09907.1 pseudaminic acid biosynthesis-associated protein PseG [Acetivibrio thermocellus AD2]ANV77681.1 pseudaminic acid biosynthesis-associated protein PseG [Acetivibrio thermocellus DSM 2360]EIC03896.1 pseudaminic acid b
MLNIGIRVDGSANIGMGHIMRCLSLAKGFRNAGANVYFLSRFEQGISRIRQDNFEVLEMPYRKSRNSGGFFYGDASELEEDAEEIICRIRAFNLDVLIIDSYNVSREFFLKLKPHVRKLCYIDDLNKFVYPVDVLINGNITAPALNYAKYSDDELMLLGLKYNLIRDEFKNLPERIINRDVREIMITTGGSDPFNLTLRLANAILPEEEFKDVRINIVVGSGFTNADKLRELSERNPNVVLHENVLRMSEVMLKSDVAISAGGSTLYELCACGTPALAVVIADNQREMVDMLSSEGYIISLGWHEELDDRELLRKVKSLCGDYEKRVLFSRKMQKLVDGEGVKRVVEEIMKITS